MRLQCGNKASMRSDFVLCPVLLSHYMRCCLQAQQDQQTYKETRGSSHQKTFHAPPWQTNIYRYIFKQAGFLFYFLFLLRAAICHMAACEGDNGDEGTPLVFCSASPKCIEQAGPQCSGHKVCKHNFLATVAPQAAARWDFAKNIKI